MYVAVGLFVTVGAKLLSFPIAVGNAVRVLILVGEVDIDGLDVSVGIVLPLIPEGRSVYVGPVVIVDKVLGGVDMEGWPVTDDV